MPVREVSVMNNRVLLCLLPWRSPLRITKRQGVLFMCLHLLIALLVVCPFLPGPNSFRTETNWLFIFFQTVSLPSLLLVPMGLLWTSQHLRPAPPIRSPLYALLLWTVPLLICWHCGWSAEWLREASRKRAMHQSESLLQALATYRTKHQQYPAQLDKLLPDYLPQLPSPGIMGIADYGYARHADCFQISFAQNVLLGFNFEVVVYDPHDHYQAKGDLPTLYDAGAPHWQYYIYD